MKRWRTLLGGGRPARPPEDLTESILGRHLDGDFNVFPMAETATSPEQIVSIGEKYGVRFPPELVAHLCGRFPGIYVEVKEELWPRPKLGDVGEFWSFLYAIHTYTSAPESLDWMRLDTAAESFQKDTGFVAVPILKVVGDADVYCVDAEDRLIQYRHELNEFEPVPLNFWQLFERELADLHARKVQKLSCK